MGSPFVIAPGFWGDSADHIVVIENFIDTHELLFLSEYASVISSWDTNKGDDAWGDRVHGIDEMVSCNPEVREICTQIWKNANAVINEHFSMTFTGRAPSIVRWRIGDGQSPHADKQLPDGSPSRNPENDVGSVIYLNDNYEGGEIYFPKQNIRFKPKSGSFAFFPGDVNYMHGVETITKGTRYTLPNFWTAKP